MTNKKTTIILTLVLIAVLLGGTVLYSSLSRRNADTPQAAQRAAQRGEQTAAADFAMVDADGNSVLLSDHTGVPIVLNFWASWCGPCKKEMPEFDAIAAEYAGKVDFMMVNLTDGSRETVESAARFIEKQGYTFPVFFDTLSEGAQAYSVRSIPVTFFIDADGNVLEHSVGSMNEKTLRQGVEALLAE